MIPLRFEPRSWSTEERARRSFRNVSRLLRPGGYFVGTTVDANVLVRKLREADGLVFGNPIVEVRFDDAHKTKLFPPERGPFGLQYAFTLADAVTDCEEWMVPKKAFVELAEEYGLELVEWSNFHDFAHRKLGAGDPGEDADPNPKAKPGEVRGGRGAAHALWRQTMGGRGAAEATLTEDEWEAAHLYTTFAFKMGGGGAAAARAIMTRPEPPPPAQIRREDVLVLEGAA